MSLLTDVVTVSRRNLIAVPVLLTGAAVSVALGIAGTHFWPGTQPLPTWGFSAPQIFKAYLSSAVGVLIVGQVLTAVWIYGFHAPKPVHTFHRLSGALAFLLSLPVAFYCLYSFGFQVGQGATSTRVMAHSIAGVVFYGAFASKMLTLRLKRTPGWLLPILGATVFTSFVLAWTLAAFWWFRTVGFAR